MGSLRPRNRGAESKDGDWLGGFVEGVAKLFSSAYKDQENESRAMKQLVTSIECEPLKTPDEPTERCGVVYSDLGSSTVSLRRRYCDKGFLLAIFLAILSITLTSIMWFTSVYNNAVLKLVSIRDDLDMVFELWRLPPPRSTVSVYAYNYTNFQDILDGKALPHVQEVGPFVFKEKMERINVKFHPNSTVSFQEKRTITFWPEKTNVSLNATINVPNVPLLSVLQKAMHWFFIEQKTLETYLATIKAEPFQKVSVHDFIWGHEDNFFGALKTLASTLGKPVPQPFGILAKRKGEHHDIITMETGQSDLSKLGLITHWNGETKIGKWHEACDDVYASDGSQFPAQAVRSGDPLFIYSNAMCRRMPIKFNRTTSSHDGFPVQQYNVDENMFDFSGANKNNTCFKYKGAYPPNGVFYSGPCQGDSPIYSSFPHFWMASDEVRSKVSGLSPDPEKHRSYLHIHKDLGISLLVKTKFQINIMVEKSMFMGLTSKLISNKLLLPIAWVDFNSGELPDYFVDILYHLTYTVKIVEVTLKLFFLLSTLTILAFLGFQIRKRALK